MEAEQELEREATRQKQEEDRWKQEEDRQKQAEQEMEWEAYQWKLEEDRWKQMEGELEQGKEWAARLKTELQALKEMLRGQDWEVCREHFWWRHDLTSAFRPIFLIYTTHLPHRLSSNA